MVGAGVDHPLGDLQRKPGHRDLAYNKGFLVWNMLSRELGRDKFRRILHSLTRRYAFRNVAWSQFLRAIETGAGRDLSWFYEQWFKRTGAPEWQLTWKQHGGRVRGVITQAAPHYRATLEVLAQGAGGQTSVKRVRVSGARAEFSMPVGFRVQSVTLDPHYLWLRWTPEFHSVAEAARPVQTEHK